MPESLLEIEEEMQESLNWTTPDEIGFLRQMYRNGNLTGLEKYRHVLQYRTYRGEGMAVDRELVEMALSSLIDVLSSGGQ